MRVGSGLPLVVLALSLQAAASASAAGTGLEDAVERGAQASATVADDGVVRIGWQRDDVAVRVDRVDFPPPAGLGSWAAFKPAGDGVAMVMGDTVVFEDEISPAMDAAFTHGLKVTALHNHFVYDDPPVYFMHIGGRGDAQALAQGVKAVWDAIRSVRDEHAKPRRRSRAGALGSGELDVQSLERVLGVTPAVNGGVAKFTFARNVRLDEVDLGGPMGVSTWAAFIGDDGSAAVDGDFMMTAREVQPVMRALRRNDIHVVALHNHMIGEEPPAYFLHFWGRGPAERLAEALRETLDAQRQASALSR